MGYEVSHEDKSKVKVRQSEDQQPAERQQPPLTRDRIQGKLDPPTVKQMQRALGNAAVQRMLVQRAAAGPTEVDDEIAGQISASRGSGAALDEGIADRAGQALGQDFTNVNVHTDGAADNLSRSLSAKAFTTGSDIYFREGAYQPATSDGQRLIAHELTHVVQQGGSSPSVQAKMTVNDPNDQYEAEADQVANTIMSMPEEAVTQRQEEDEELQAKLEDGVHRQEDEELQGKLDDSLQRQEGLEDEELA
jgi:hypothetical protein